MRITKAMLESQNRFLSRKLDKRDTEIGHLREIIALLQSPQSGYGQTASMVIALERISESVAHVLSDLRKHTEWKEKWLTQTTKDIEQDIQRREMLNGRGTIVSSREPRTKAKGGKTKTKTKS